MVDFCLDNLESVWTPYCLGETRLKVLFHIGQKLRRIQTPVILNSRLGKPLTDIPRIVFSNSLNANKWDVANHHKRFDIEEIKILKKSRKDIIVYGGNSFVSSLVKRKLIDEYYLLANPLAISSDEPIFKFLNSSLQLTLKDCKPFPCGTILLCYRPSKI